MLHALHAQTMTSAFLATLVWSMVTIPSMHSNQRLRILISTSLPRPFSALAVTLDTMLSAMAVIRYGLFYYDSYLVKLILCSTSMAFVTSASIAQTGTSAQPATSMLASSMLATALCPSMNPSTTSQPCRDHSVPRLVTTASTATDLFATTPMALNPTLRVIVISVLSAMTLISVPAARLAHRTHTTRLTL